MARTLGPVKWPPRAGSAVVRAICSVTTTTDSTPMPWPPNSSGTSISQRPSFLASSSNFFLNSGLRWTPSVVSSSMGIISVST